jgi:histidine triad (HIT) family protein
MENNCVFCKIVEKVIPSTKIFEDDNMIIIRDINPIAPLHYLLIVKEHYGSLHQQSIAQAHILGECLNKLSIIKSSLGLEKGFRLIINQGENAGQTVDHLHVHIVGGKKLDWNQL